MNTTTLDQGQTSPAATSPSQSSGASDQLSGMVQKGMTAAKDMLGQSGGLADKAKSFAKQRPAATAALVGVIGLAVLNTLRGK